MYQAVSSDFQGLGSNRTLLHPTPPHLSNQASSQHRGSFIVPACGIVIPAPDDNNSDTTSLCFRQSHTLCCAGCVTPCTAQCVSRRAAAQREFDSLHCHTKSRWDLSPALVERHCNVQGSKRDRQEAARKTGNGFYERSSGVVSAHQWQVAARHPHIHISTSINVVCNHPNPQYRSCQVDHTVCQVCHGSQCRIDPTAKLEMIR